METIPITFEGPIHRSHDQRNTKKKRPLPANDTNYYNDDINDGIPTGTTMSPTASQPFPDVRHDEFSQRRLPPLSIDTNFDSDEHEEYDDEYDETGSLLHNTTTPSGFSTRHRRKPTTARRKRTMQAHFRIPSVRLPSRNSMKSRRGVCCDGDGCYNPVCSRGIFCCMCLMLVLPLIGYLGEIRDKWLPSIESVGNAIGKEITESKNTKTTPYGPIAIEGNYSFVQSIEDIEHLAEHVSVQCFHNQSSCPCQRVSSSSDSIISRGSDYNNNNSMDETTEHQSPMTTNSRLVPCPGELDGWDTAYTWNVQTVSSSRGTNANVVFLGDSITERWRGTRLGIHLPPLSSSSSSQSNSDNDVSIAQTFDRLFRTTTTTGTTGTTTDRNNNGDDDETEDVKSRDSDSSDDSNTTNNDNGIGDFVNETDANSSDSDSDSDGDGSLLDDNTNIPLHSIPLGIAGDQTTNLLWRLENGELPSNLHPDIFVVLIGTNDLNKDQCSAENVVVGILRCVEYLLAERPNARILLHGLLPRTFDKKGYLKKTTSHQATSSLSGSSTTMYVWSTIQLINSELKRYSDQRQSVEYFEASKIFIKSSNQIDLDLIPDGTHPSPQGYKVWGKTLQTKIRQMMKNDA